MHNIEIISAKLLLSAFLGGLIGIERDMRGRTAGLRTHILVCVGSCLFMLISTYIFETYKFYYANSILRIDPGRIASQIITGIGFIGAGTILRSGFSIRGLTTAGSIWVCAGIGMGVGLGYYNPSLLATVITLIALLLLNRIELLYLKDTFFEINIKLKNENNIFEKFLKFIEKENLVIRDFVLKNNIMENLVEISFKIVMKRKGIKRHYFSKTLYSKIIDEFGNFIVEIKWMRS